MKYLRRFLFLAIAKINRSIALFRYPWVTFFKVSLPITGTL